MWKEALKTRCLHNTYIKPWEKEGNSLRRYLKNLVLYMVNKEGRRQFTSALCFSNSRNEKWEKKSHHQRNLLHLRQSDSNTSAIKPCVFLKPHAEKVCSSKPPEVREVSINVKSILRGQVTFKSFSFPNFLPAKRSREDAFIWASFHSKGLHSAPKVRTLNISVCILLDIYPRLSYISYLWD